MRLAKNAEHGAEFTGPGNSEQAEIARSGAAWSEWRDCQPCDKHFDWM